MAVPPFLESKALKEAGFRHAFSTRAAGEAKERDQAVVAAVGATRLSQATQVHGDVVVRAGLPLETKGDALIATEPGDAVGVRVADCVPILLAAPSGRVAAVHAGWRGVVNGIIGKAIAELRAAELRAVEARVSSRPIAAVGPHIGPCCFEVGEEVVDQLGKEFVDRRAGEKAFMNLRHAVHAQLRAAGIELIDDVGECTKCNPATYHSFRRDAEASGRMIAVIVAR